MGEIIISEDKDNDQAVYTLSFSKRHFGKFIADILSENKTVTRRIRGTFSIDKKWIDDLLAMIMQRVSLQNTSILVSGSATIYYKGGLEQSFNSMTSFQTFRDFRKEVTCGFSANLTYLVEFPGRAPERQFINISGKTHEAFQNTVEDRVDFSVISDLVSFMQDCGVFEIEVGYTEISWVMT